ncbi:efflux RND transporter periplasmic adaptor subunit [Novosphingobium terrae]|uniref:efflux RND transporter periplasmic adaptor subunit n=1 Tax=Novosphingobium terrae TaxID=2726189 RepID=UPI001F13CC60|nr:efflux RND transporter periplasmic adaptor subunit [Novosphingobium terrae]
MSAFLPSIPRRRWLWLALGLGLLVLLWLGASRLMADPAEGFETATVTRGDVEETVSALGKLQPRTYVDVGAQASGQLKRLLVQPGDQVKAGQLLAEIDPQVQAARLESDRAERDRLIATLKDAQAQADYAQGELARQQQLRAANATRTDVFDQARRDAISAQAKAQAIRAQIVQAESTLKSDAAQLGYTSIYAPMGGTVVSVDVRQGQTINANYTAPVLLRIADLSAMTVWTQVSEADVGQLKPGMSLWFTTLGYGERRWSARLRQILPAPPKPVTSDAAGAQPASAAASANNVVLYTALFDVPNGDGLLRPEMSAQVFFITASAHRRPTVPMTALTLTDKPGRYTAQVVSGRRLETRSITIGTHDRFTAQVLSGLSEGERVVTGRKPGGEPSLLSLRW